MLKINSFLKIFSFILASIFLSSAYLFFIDSRYSDSHFSQDWFALSFADPKNDSLDFFIENFSSCSDFHWEIIQGEERLTGGFLHISPQKKTMVSPSFPLRDQSEKIIVRVFSEKETLEIYKHN